MDRSSTLARLEARIQRSKRSGKLVLGGVLVVSLVFAAVLVQGLFLAQEIQREDLVIRAFLGLALLAGLNIFSILAIRRQHRMLDEARRELEEIVNFEAPH